jgi:hypothetical protein
MDGGVRAMVINTQTYDDFKLIVAGLSLPKVFSATQAFHFQASAISDEVAVVLDTYDGVPTDFATDFPAAITLGYPVGYA